MTEIRKKLSETTEFLKSRIKSEPLVGIILGSGLGNLVEHIEVDTKIPYQDIPHFPVSTVKGHSGQLVFWKIGSKSVVAMQGRIHYYEGYSMQEVTYPVRSMKFLGIKYLIVSNAAGGVNPKFAPGDLMLIVDHINLMPENPLRGPNDEALGPRFPSMHNAYDRDLRQLALSVAAELGIPLQQGVYVALQGPNLETPAEYLFVRTIGGDAVGMSTVPEVIVANHMGVRVLGFSVITNVANPYDPKETTHEEVLKAADRAGKKLIKLVSTVIGRLP